MDTAKYDIVQRDTGAPGIAISFLVSAAALAAAAFGPCNLNLPDDRTLFDVFPTEFVGVTGGDLMVKRPRIMIAGDMHSRTRRQRRKRSENCWMALRRRDGPYVSFRDVVRHILSESSIWRRTSSTVTELYWRYRWQTLLRNKLPALSNGKLRQGKEERSRFG